MLDCNDFFRSIGWRCTTIEAAGSQALYVSTPFRVGQTKPLCFYTVGDASNGFELTDDGMVMQVLRSLGHQLDDKRHWRSLESFAQPLGISVDETGAFSLKVEQRNLRDAAARWLQLYAAIVTWDSERLTVDAPDAGLDDEIEQVLAQVDAFRQLIVSPKITLNNVDHWFSFQWGDTFIDGCAAHQAATNARLRKALLVQQTDPDVKLLFVVDDRGSLVRADQEVLVLSTVVHAVALRQLPEVARRLAA